MNRIDRPPHKATQAQPFSSPAIRRTYARGRLIPATADLLLHVMTGVVAQMVIHPDGTEVLLGLHGPQQLLVPHPTDSCYLHLQAHTDVQLLAIPWAQAMTMPDLVATLRSRLWQQEAWASMQARPYLEDRILGILTLLAEQFGQPTSDGLLLNVRLTHTQLATAVGATRTTVTRMVSKLRRQGLVRTVGKGQDERFCLHNRGVSQHITG